MAPKLKVRLPQTQLEGVPAAIIAAAAPGDAGTAEEVVISDNDDDDFQPGSNQKVAPRTAEGLPAKGKGKGKGKKAAAEPAQARKSLRERKRSRAAMEADLKLGQLPIGAEAVGKGADDLEEEGEDADEYFRLGAQDEHEADFAKLQLKGDHQNRPIWVCPDGRIFLETFSPAYKNAEDFMIAIAEPVCRPETVHEYVLTPHSLYAAVSVGLTTDKIIQYLSVLSKVQLSKDIKDFIRKSTSNYGKVKLVLQRNSFFVESKYPEVLRELLRDDVINRARIQHADMDAEFAVSQALKEQAAQEITALMDNEGMAADEEAAMEAEMEMQGIPPPGMAIAAGGVRPDPGMEAARAIVAATEEERQLHSFEIDASQVEHVKQRCLPGGLNYPMLEEYDFRNDTVNPNLAIDLKPTVTHRPYQTKSLSKMFGNGRARSGIIVLPCGAGKSLVGISAAARIKKSVLCLVTNSVSVDQWKYQFKLWTNLQDHQISKFTSDSKEQFAGVSGVCITTYTMIAYSGKRSEESEAVVQNTAGQSPLTLQVMNEIKKREWGLLLMDEVHVVPAQMFRKVIGITKAHCKLGLTATLVREDERIGDLNFLIGPKLYEANWLDLTNAGHIAKVSCVEVWCEMTKEFYAEYLKPERSKHRQLMYVMNPNKFRACQYLIHYHEQMRSDKVIVFSDNIFALRSYAVALNKPFIYGATSHAERTRVLHAFKHSATVNTIFLSKVGDNSIDIPEANVLIQISSHAGSRRQEAQRLGRILRAKKTKPGATGELEYNAFFYTLVSKDTQEMFYSAKRQQFLIDQGYSFKVITNLLDGADNQDLMYGTKEEQTDLLASVLVAGENEVGEEADTAADDVSKTVKAVTRRTVGSMSKMSGASGMYMEYASAVPGGKKPKAVVGAKAPTKPKSFGKESLTYKYRSR